MAGTLEGRVALVTGGASGLGRATASVFAREGALVVVADRTEDAGAEVARSIEEGGGAARFVRCDVTEPAEVDALVQEAFAWRGRLDCAFNNAGIEGPLGRTHKYADDDWRRVIEVNLTGVFSCVRAELDVMLRQGHGAIVNTASVAGLVGMRGLVAYTASKHGVVGLTKAVALEYATANVRVNAVCPGIVQTPMLERMASAHAGMHEQMVALEPVGRTGQADEIAEAVAWLCSDRASFVTGHAMAVDGGYLAR